MWDSGLEDAEGISDQFRDEVLRMTGTTPSRRGCDILRVVVCDSDGEPCADIP